MTVHLVYPYQPPPGRAYSAPWTIGMELGKALRKAGHQVVQYDWDQPGVIAPSPGDILIGHPSPEPGRVFRSSLCAPWSRVIGIAPWNGSDEYTERMDATVMRSDHTFLICGGYWAQRRPDRWMGRTTCLDMFVPIEGYPWLDIQRRPPGRRRFLYIGCTVPQKNTAYLEALISATGYTVGHAGYGRVAGSIEHGMVDFQSEAGRRLVAEYDYLIMTGSHDANPTTVLEAAAWGLVPVLTDGCGWTSDDLRAVRLPDCDGAEVMREAQSMPTDMLEAWAAHNRERALSVFTPARFTPHILDAIA
jgi:hypothetical protein